MMTHHQLSMKCKTSDKLHINQAIIDDGTTFSPALLRFNLDTSDELNDFISRARFVGVGIVQKWLR